MPSPPGSCPSRQLTVRLPWSVWARLCALAAADPHGARPGRVAATALALGLDALEGAGSDADEATVPGMAREVVYGSGTEGPGGPSLKTILFGHEPTPVERARTLLAAMVDRLPCLPEREDLEALQEVLGAPDAPRPAPPPADAPTGPPAPALARRMAAAWQPPPNDPRWALDATGNPYAREAHTIGAMAPNGRRVEVAVAAGDTVAVVGERRRGRLG